MGQNIEKPQATGQGYVGREITPDPWTWPAGNNLEQTENRGLLPLAVMGQEFPCQVDLTQSAADREVRQFLFRALRFCEKLQKALGIFLAEVLEKVWHLPF